MAYFRLPLFFLEATLGATLATITGVFGISYSGLAGLLPLRYHDIIYVELPGLSSFLVGLADEDEAQAQGLITEAASSLGQRRAARLALSELQARSLERAASGRLYARAANLDLPFLAGGRGEEPGELILPFQAAAANLRAAVTSRSHLHRRRALDRAFKALSDAQLAIAARRRPGRQARRLLTTLRVWLDVVGEEQAILARDEAAHPQVPIPFVAGPSLGPDDRELFKGRNDLIRIIDHDLTGDRRAPIVLIGQRRMGKSSFLNMLPIQLGTGTRVVKLNFQELSLSPHRAQPHRWIAEEVAAAQAGAPDLPAAEAAWSATLDWLRAVDSSLVQADQRLLVALDEVERLEDGIREGWATTDLLDLIRAAGDGLSHLRFLLATAYPLPRLGPHWVDRLINVLPRQLRPLSEADARALICEPMPGFPDVYPPGGVERIIAATGGHPYLVQLVCDTLCRLLNEAERLRATPDDVEAALDRAILETTLFDELWRQRSDDERRVLQVLAGGEDLGADLRSVVRNLEREGYVHRGEDRPAIAVPMFAIWIAETT